MTRTEIKKLLSLVKEKKLSVISIGIYSYLSITQGDMLKYGEIASDLNKAVNVIKQHVRLLEKFRIINRKSMRRGIVFNISPTRLWVASGIYSIHTNKSYYKEEIQEILNDLSGIAKHTFNSSEKTRGLIIARLAEGHTVAEFLRVHKNKKDWLGSEKMFKFYRPATLYTKAHFSDYLEELVNSKSTVKHTSSKWKGEAYQDEIKKTKSKLAVLDEKDFYYDEEDTV